MTFTDIIIYLNQTSVLISRDIQMLATISRFVSNGVMCVNVHFCSPHCIFNAKSNSCRML